ncbi:MAG: SGNH/GDSL hydrolase family protein [Noviherbaspirillum sp.]
MFSRPASLLAAVFLLLAGCGGDSDSDASRAPQALPEAKPVFASVVSFGDSLSDVGTYAPLTNGATQGKITTDPGPIWVENVAARLGLGITPYIVGISPVSSTWEVCARPACTGYAQGGARITDPAGGANENGLQLAALTQPVRTQIANHLDVRGGVFRADELVFVFAGNNDVFFQAKEFGRLAADPAVGPEAARQAAGAAIAAAANELVTYLRDDIVAKGGRYVVVMNLPYSSLSPFGQSRDANGRAVLDFLVDTFNATLAQGIAANQLAVKLYDTNAAAAAIYRNPAAFGVVNIQEPACDREKIEAATLGLVTDGTALFCSRDRLTAAAARDSRFLFADRVHPSTLGHRLISDGVIQYLAGLGWL